MIIILTPEPGVEVRVVAEFAHRLLDAEPRVLAHQVEAMVDQIGDRLDRHLGARGHIAHRRSTPSPSPL